MPDESWNLSLGRAVEGVLETMFFAAVDGIPEDGMPDAADSVGARLTFRGHESGTLSVQLTTAAAQSLAADFLGSDRDEITGEQRTEVVCELANMICGSMMSELEAEGLIRLTPAVSFTGAAPPASLQPAAECAVELQEGALRVVVERDRSHA